MLPRMVSWPDEPGVDAGGGALDHACHHVGRVRRARRRASGCGAWRGSRPRRRTPSVQASAPVSNTMVARSPAPSGAAGAHARRQRALDAVRGGRCRSGWRSSGTAPALCPSGRRDGQRFAACRRCVVGLRPVPDAPYRDPSLLARRPRRRSPRAHDARREAGAARLRVVEPAARRRRLLPRRGRASSSPTASGTSRASAARRCSARARAPRSPTRSSASSSSRRGSASRRSSTRRAAPATRRATRPASRRPSASPAPGSRR